MFGLKRIKNKKILKVAERYYKIQTYIDLGWGEFSWFNDSLIELMALIFILERIGVVVEGSIVYFILFGAFIFFYVAGRILKVLGIYDKSQYVDAEIDPVAKEVLEAARIIIKDHSEKLEKERILEEGQ